MNLRVAKKVRDRVGLGFGYRRGTYLMAQRRLKHHGLPPKHWFLGMLDSMAERDPIGFARFQFESEMSLIAEFGECP